MRIFLLLSFMGLFLSCQEDEPDEKIYPTTLQGGWVCVNLKSGLKTSREELDKDINGKLSNYKPDLVLDFTANTCTFHFSVGGDGQGMETYAYYLEKEQIIYNGKNIPESNDEKIRANIRLKDNKLYMTFDCSDFKNYVHILGDNYPFHQDFLNPTVGGSVTITFNRQQYEW